jgi:hypothetical protein
MKPATKWKVFSPDQPPFLARFASSPQWDLSPLSRDWPSRWELIHIPDCGSLRGKRAFMIEQFLAFWFYFGPVFGMPLLAIGVILRLCERSWGKVKGEMGSRGFLIAGGLLVSPFVVYVVWGLLT